MNVAALIAALDLPASARVDQRVPKKLLVENGAPTAADKHQINDGIDEVQWLAALKPTTIGVPEYRDQMREYLEIAVLSMTLRGNAKGGRLTELVHRAVPYPVFLIAAHGADLWLSLAHKRWSQGETGKTVLDGEVVAAELGTLDDTLARPFLDALPLAHQPRTTLHTLYQGWVDTVLALQAAGITGTFRSAGSPEAAAVRREALQECARLEAQIVTLRAAAAKEHQVPRQVELNLQLRRVRAAHAAARAQL